MSLPKLMIKAIDKKIRLSLERPRGHSGGNCLVYWQRVQQQLRFCGLGIHE
jgi:hypothetical protein